MGKIRTRILGMEEVEEKQKKEQKEKATQKKADKKKTSVIASKAKQSQKDLPAGKAGTASSPVAPRSDKKSPKRHKTISVKPRGKRYQEAKKIIYSSSEVEKNSSRQVRTIKEAVKLLKQIHYAKFDESIELHLLVNEVGLKGEVELPHSTGKTVKVTVVDDKVLEEIEKGKIDFDILVAHPSFMPRLARFAKVLGPKGLMPNPKAGTISPKPEQLVKKFAKGLLRWKTEAKFPLIHQMIGKISFKDEDLIENGEKFITVVGPKHITKAYIKSTMSPSIKLKLD